MKQNKILAEKQTSEWKVIIQEVLEFNSLMAVGMNDLWKHT